MGASGRGSVEPQGFAACRSLPAPEVLVGAMDVLGVPFLQGGIPPNVPVAPSILIAGLAAQQEPRLRLALIPLLLARPHLASVTLEALELLDPTTQPTLQIYYTAARLLQAHYTEPLARLLGPQEPLPDLFGARLGLPEGDGDKQLAALAAYHRALTGRAINWLGTYHHGAQRLLARLEAQARWTTP